MLEKLICQENRSLIEVLKVININTFGTAFIVDSSNKLKGIITDGDVRRILLKGVGLEATIGDHVNTDFVFSYDDEDLNTVLSKTSEKIQIIPIVNSNFELVNFARYNRKMHLPVAAPNLKGNEFNYLVDAFLSTWISSSGEYINRFENDFSNYCGTKYGVAVSNGTVAIHLALETLGIGKGDEVIVPDFTFAATINAVLHTGATPVIVDIEKDSWCISPSEIRNAITPNTKAIIPVHIYGQPCDMDAIMDIAKEHSLFVVEDCAEAHGAKYKGKKVGGFGDISCFSFFANKVITTGEGGMCLTKSDQLDDKMRVLRDHGMSKTKRYWHEHVGYNYRMTNLQAAIGVAQIERIDEIITHKKEIEDSYRNYLKDISYVHVQTRDIKDTERITWLVCLTIDKGDRDATLLKLKEKGVDARPFFYPLSEMEIYKKYVVSNANSVILSKIGMNLPSIDVLNEKTSELIREVFLNELN